MQQRSIRVNVILTCVRVIAASRAALLRFWAESVCTCGTRVREIVWKGEERSRERERRMETEMQTVPLVVCLRSGAINHAQTLHARALIPTKDAVKISDENSFQCGSDGFRPTCSSISENGNGGNDGNGSTGVFTLLTLL